MGKNVGLNVGVEGTAVGDKVEVTVVGVNFGITVDFADGINYGVPDGDTVGADGAIDGFTDGDSGMAVGVNED